MNESNVKNDARARRLTNRQQELLEFLQRHGPATRSQVAAALGCLDNTAGVHLHALYRADRAWPQRRGAGALWGLTKPPSKDNRRLEQVSSVWEFAARHAARHAKAR